MSRTSISPCFLLALMLSALSCGKEKIPPTVIKGRITDRKTGEPLQGAYTIFSVERKDNGSGNTGQPSPLSDANGEFSCTLNGDYAGAEETYQEGYITKSTRSNFVNGQTNSMEVQLIPRDGFLKLRIENNTGQHDILYANIYSRTEDIEKNFYNAEVIKEYPLLLNKGEVYIEVFGLGSPDVVQIMWGFKAPSNQMPHTIIDSVMVFTNDTSTYILSY